MTGPIRRDRVARLTSRPQEAQHDRFDTDAVPFPKGASS
jgi:hypothetical protein